LFNELHGSSALRAADGREVRVGEAELVVGQQRCGFWGLGRECQFRLELKQTGSQLGADFLKAPGQDVLEEAADELEGR
jgi:hypothetical protein